MGELGCQTIAFVFTYFYVIAAWCVRGLVPMHRRATRESCLTNLHAYTHAPYAFTCTCTGISTVHGNQTVRKTAINAARTCVFAGLEHVDVVEGASAPLVRSPRACPEIHGDTGLDGTALLPPPDHPAVLARLERWRGRKAAVVMAEEILRAPRNVTLVATGACVCVCVMMMMIVAHCVRASRSMRQ